MANDTAILVYVPDTKWFVDQFWGLYESVQHSSDNRRKFSFVVICSSSAREKLPDDNCDYFVREQELSERPEYCFRYSGNPYKYINSFHHFEDEEVLNHLRLKYTYCLRMDVDTFVTPIAYRLGVEFQEIKVGHGGYASEESTERLKQTCRDLGIRYNSELHNVGSSWFGYTQDVISMGKSVCEYAKYLINNDSVFVEGEGEWPRWYAGVVSMYAGHLAACKHNFRINKFELDIPTGGQFRWDETYTAHCWHSGDFFSKFEFAAGNYDSKKITTGDWEKSRLLSDYAFWCAKNGRALRMRKHVYDGEESIPYKNIVYFQTYLVSGEGIGDRSIQNFKSLRDSLDPSKYDVMLCADVSRHSVEEYKKDYGVDEVIAYHDSCPDIMSLRKVKGTLDFWAHPHLPIMHHYKNSSKKYLYYYAVEHDLFSDDWASVFDEVEKHPQSFICSHVIQLNTNPDKREDFFEKGREDWIYWMYADKVHYKNPLGHIGAFVRYDFRALDTLIEKVPEYPNFFFEFILPTIFYGEGVSINTLSKIADNDDGSLKFTIYHSKGDPQERLGTGAVYWARECTGGQMGPV